MCLCPGYLQLASCCLHIICFWVLPAHLSFESGTWLLLTECFCTSQKQGEPEGQIQKSKFQTSSHCLRWLAFIFVPLHKCLCWGVQNRLYRRTCLWGLPCACSWSWLEASQLLVLRLQNCAGVARDRLCFSAGLNKAPELHATLESHSIPGRARLQLCCNAPGMPPPACDHKPTQKL